MAKNLLAGFSIGGDIIDRVAPAEPPRNGKSIPEIVFPVPPQNPADSSAGSPSAGDRDAGHPGQPGATEQLAAIAHSDECAVAQGTTEPQETTPTTGTPEQAGTTAPLHQPDEPGTAGTTAATEPPSDFAVKKDGLFQVFTIGQTIYRVGGVKPLFVTSLRVNIRATSGELSYYDSLDLYSAKSRQGFAAALNRAWGMEPSRVEKDLVRILEDLERERDEQLRTSSQKPVITITAEDRALGMEVLKDPHIFSRIVTDLSALGYVGEDLNKQLLYLCASSRKLDDPISVLILSQSASGKSFLVDSVKKLMPPEDVVAVTSLSDQALNYIDDLMHKFLVLGEAVHGEVVEHQIREMLSGKELSRMVTIKDPETGKMQSRIVRTPVVVASVLSGTNHAVNPENASRCFMVNTDESKEQTARIHEHQRQKYSLQRIKAGADDLPRIVRAHHAAQRLLTKRMIINSFAPLLDFPTSLMRLRRDHDRFLDLIACVCFLRQYQKPTRQEGPAAYIECDLEDYSIAYRIMVEGVMSATIRELPKGAVVVYEEIREWVKAEAARQGLKMPEVSFTQRQVREATGLGHTWVKNNLRQLVDFEYITVSNGGGERFRGVYRLRADEDIIKADLSMIPTPEVMRTLATGGKV
jgi:hypothetical protein